MTTTVNTDRTAAVERLYAYYENQGPYHCALGMDPNSPLAATALMHLDSDVKSSPWPRWAAWRATISFICTPWNIWMKNCWRPAAPRRWKTPSAAWTPTRTIISPWPLSYSCATQSPPQQQAKLKKTKFHKDYVKPESGWADLRLAAVEIKPGGRTAANPLGKTLLNICKAAL